MSFLVLQGITILLEVRSLNKIVGLDIYETALALQHGAEAIVRQALDRATKIGGIDAIEPSAVWPVISFSFSGMRGPAG